jgi:hypothetical protein
LPPTALDDRTFESAVELTPEEQESNLQYFRDDKGYDVEVEAAAPGTEKPLAVPATTTEEAKVAPTTDAPAGDKPTETQPAAIPAHDSEIDTESRTEFETAKNDGEKLGRWAKKNKDLREARGAIAQKETELAAEKARNEELRRQLTERPAPGATPSSNPLAPATVAPVEEAKPEPIKAAEFGKEKPVRPKMDDFKDADDPYAALLEAQGEYTEKLADWKDEKRSFDDEQRALVAKQTQEQEQARNQQTNRQQTVQQRFEAARIAHPDFEATTGKAVYTPVMRYLLLEELPDGLELGYQLAKPENAEKLSALVAKTKDAKSPDEIQKALYETVADLAVFRHTLNSKPANGNQAPAAEAAPASAAVATEPPATEKTVQTPSTTQPRREEAAPVPVRGRGAAADRLEDIPLEDYDARKEWRKRNGQL